MDNNFIVQLIARLDSSKTATDINKIEQELNKRGVKLEPTLDMAKSKQELRNFAEQLHSILGESISVGNITSAINQIKKETDSLAAKANNIKLSIDTNGKTSADIQVLKNNFSQLGLSADAVKDKINGVQTEFTELRNLIDSGASNQAIIDQFNKLNLALMSAQGNLRVLRSEQSLLATEQQRLTLANNIEAWNQKNTAATKSARAENERYIQSLRDLSQTMTKVQFARIQTGFKNIENSMRGLGRLGASFKNQMTQAASSFSVWLSASSAVMKLITETRQAMSELKDVDTYLTEISKANDELTKSQLAGIGNNSFDVASKYGKKATDYLSAVQEASRAGYENAEGMAELSTAAQGAGDMTADVANQFIIATDKAYKLEGSIDALTKVMDGVNYITNHNAVNMTELSEGMSVVASTAASFGVETNELTAALGTMAATTQQSGSEVARAFRAILLNIRQVSDEEENIDAEGLTKYEKACNALGVSLKETRNGVLQLRDPMEVLEELSEAYNKLDESDLKRTQLLNSVGGKVYHVVQKCITRMNLIAGNPLEPYTTI